jgi:hypothetical protein
MVLLPACFSSSEMEAALTGVGVETAGDAILPGEETDPETRF